MSSFIWVIWIFPIVFWDLFGYVAILAIFTYSFLSFSFKIGVISFYLLISEFIVLFCEVFRLFGMLPGYFLLTIGYLTECTNIYISASSKLFLFVEKTWSKANNGLYGYINDFWADVPLIAIFYFFKPWLLMTVSLLKAFEILFSTCSKLFHLYFKWEYRIIDNIRSANIFLIFSQILFQSLLV